VIARGLVAFSSDELHDMLGRSTGDLRAERGSTFGRPVIHRDDLVLL
jgi:glutamate 5-kinase